MPFQSTNDGYEEISDATEQLLQIDTKSEFHTKLYGYEQNKLHLISYHFLGIIFLGIPYIICCWYPHLLAKIKYRKCSLKNASLILISDNYGNNQLIQIKTEYTTVPNIDRLLLRYFHYQNTKYVWISSQEVFGSLDSLIPPATVDDYLHDTEGLFYTNYNDLLQLYGLNKIEIEVKSYSKLFIEEVFNPFYIFQAFSVILWCFDNYVVYAGCVFILTFLSAITSLLETRKQSQALHDLVQSSKCHQVQVLRQTLLSELVIQTINPSELVPGDLIVLPKSDLVIPCDAVLLTGQCIVNESTLTGESVPVTKISLHSSSEMFNCDTHKRNVLFAGTHMIQSRYYGGEKVLARVVRTGFNTTKGLLVKSMLYPTPVNLKFYKDSLKFVFVLFFIAAMGTIYCLYLYISRHAALEDIIIRSLDIITIVVPPALPAAMTIGIYNSQNRLKKLKIFSTSPPRINVCGKLKLACFDKTGTLTHDGLNMHSVLPCHNSVFSNPITNCDSLDIYSKLIQGMATCHSITQINYELSGDPLDLNMFEFTKWQLEEPGDNENARYDMLAPTVVMPKNNPSELITTEFTYQIGIIRQFPFSSTLQCMSVICRDINTQNMLAFTKGAPEKIASMCHQNSMPNDFFIRLKGYTAKGYRVIALAYKELPINFKWKSAQKVKRDVIECDLNFLGLLIMQNPLKPETAPVIKTLHNANIKTVMITGDNILTAISVAHDCEMIKANEQILIIQANSKDLNSIPEIMFESSGTNELSNDVIINFDNSHYTFAIDGKTWDKLKFYYSDLLPHILVRTKIFARFQPDQKTQLIKAFQDLDYVVSMVGDGANDCGALKAAHIGVSLSQAEASVAAPFTSSIPNISCIIHLILEGRCALVTSFAVLKFMALYSLIQFFSILILYRQHSIFGDVQFLYIDLIIITVLAVTIGRQGPSNHLGVKQPLGSLVSGKNLIPLLLQVIISALIQLSALYYLYQQKWFVPVSDHAVEEVILCWENTVLFTVSCFQYIILACAYSKGRPYRQSLITNFWFLISVLFLTIFGIYLMIYPAKIIADFFEIIYILHKANEKTYFKYTLMGFPTIHLALAIFIEVGIADSNWLKQLLNCLKRKKDSKNKYKLLLKDKYFQYWLNNINCNRSVNEDDS